MVYYGFEFNGHTPALLGSSNPESDTEYTGLLRTLTIARTAYPSCWSAWTAAVAAHLDSAAEDDGRGGTKWLLPPAAAGGRELLGEEEREMMGWEDWAEPPGEECLRYLKAMQQVLREMKDRPIT